MWEDVKGGEKKRIESLAPARDEFFSVLLSSNLELERVSFQNLNLPFQVIRQVVCQGRSIEHTLLNSFLMLFITFKYIDLWHVGLHLFSLQASPML